MRVRRCVVILFRILCRVRGEGVEAALPAAVGEQGEGGGGCASHHLRAEKVPGLFHLIAFFFICSISHFTVGDWGSRDISSVNHDSYVRFESVM